MFCRLRQSNNSLEYLAGRFINWKKKEEKKNSREGVSCVLQLAVGVWPKQSRMLLFFRVKP